MILQKQLYIIEIYTNTKLLLKEAKSARIVLCD